MFLRKFKNIFSVIGLLLGFVLSSNIYANTILTLSDSNVSVQSGKSFIVTWRASNGGDGYGVTISNCPSWMELSIDTIYQSTGRVTVSPPKGTIEKTYSCGIKACSTTYGTCDTKTITANVSDPIPAITSFSPTAVNYEERTTFTILGTDLPTTLAVWIDQCKNPNGGSLPLEVEHISDTHKVFQCIPSYSLGEKKYEIKDKSDGSLIKTGFIDVLDGSQSTVVPTLPKISIQATAFKGESITFTVKLGKSVDKPDLKVLCYASNGQKFNSIYVKQDSTVTFSGLIFNKIGSNQIACSNRSTKGASGDASKLIIVKEKTNEETVNFKLSVSVKGNGTVISSPSGINCTSDCSNDYKKGTTIKLTATPDDGYVFDSWSKDCVGKEYLCNVTMINNKNVVANFKARPTYKKHTLKFNVSGKGTFNIIALATSVTPENCKSTCTIQNAGSNSAPLTIIAKPDSGYKFSNWVGIPECSTNSTCSMTVSKNMTIGVKFVPIEIVTKKFNLNISVKGKGSVVINANSRSINCSADCPLSLEKGTSVKLTAKADNGYLFKSWSGGCTGNPCTLSMSENKTISATFEKKVVTIETFKLSVSVKGQGTVTSSPSGINCNSDCSYDYKKGTTIKLTATPKDGYILDSWDGSCVGISCEIRNMESDKSVTATFKSVDNEPRVTSISPLKIRANKEVAVMVKGNNLPNNLTMSLGGKNCNFLGQGEDGAIFNCIPSPSNKLVDIEIKASLVSLDISNTFKKMEIVNGNPDKVIDIQPIVSITNYDNNISDINNALDDAEDIFNNSNIGIKIKFRTSERVDNDSFLGGNEKASISMADYLEKFNTNGSMYGLKLDSKADVMMSISDNSFFESVDNPTLDIRGLARAPNNTKNLNKNTAYVVSVKNKIDPEYLPVVILHELGHIMGLQHGHDKDGGMKTSAFSNDSTNTSIKGGDGQCKNGKYTIMYYSSFCANATPTKEFSADAINLMKITAPEVANSYVK